MWSIRAWQRKRILARNPVAPELWQQVLDSLADTRWPERGRVEPHA